MTLSAQPTRLCVYRMIISLQLYFLVFLCLGVIDGQECFLPRDLTNCEECAAESLDLSTGCTTCVSPLSIECEEGERNCAVGNFVFSALFHSYQNPTHMCAECSDSRTPATCESVGRKRNCGLRFIYCLQPYGSPSFDPPLLPQRRYGSGSDNEIFMGDFFIQHNIWSATPNLWNRSNPFTHEFIRWPGRTQLAIAVYSLTSGVPDPRTVDKVVIDLELNTSSSFTSRRTYSGVNGFSHFDMSFQLECGVNYYGSECSIFCRAEEGVYTCNSEGNRVCVNRVLDPAMNCTTCLQPDQDPDGNCTTGGVKATTTTGPTVQDSESSTISGKDSTSSLLIFVAVVAVILLMALVLVIIFWVCITCYHNWKAKVLSVHDPADPVYDIPGPKQTTRVAEVPFAMTLSPIYGDSQKLSDKSAASLL